MGLSIQVERLAVGFVIRARGEVDLYTSPELRKAILDAVKGRMRLAVDLSGVEYMDSSGVATLVEGLKSCTAQAQEFALVRPSDSVMKVLQLSRLNRLFNIRESLEPA